LTFFELGERVGECWGQEEKEGKEGKEGTMEMVLVTKMETEENQQVINMYPILQLPLLPPAINRNQPLLPKMEILQILIIVTILKVHQNGES